MSAREVAQSQQKGPSTKERLTTIVDGFDNFDNEMKIGTIIIIGINNTIIITITITIIFIIVTIITIIITHLYHHHQAHV
jgi:hypothetical protein